MTAKKKPIVAVVGGDSLVTEFFRDYEYLVSRNWQNADILVFTGGNDIDPCLYSEEKHPQAGPYNFERDRREHIIWTEHLKKGGVSVGICRGAQLLNVFCGGKLWQHVNNHAITGTHKAMTVDRKYSFNVTSTHHQMMIPSKYGKVLLIANQATHYSSMNKSKPFSEKASGHDIEAVAYPNMKTLCFQYHPEYSQSPDEINNWTVAEIEEMYHED